MTLSSEESSYQPAWELTFGYRICDIQMLTQARAMEGSRIGLTWATFRCERARATEAGFTLILYFNPVVAQGTARTGGAGLFAGAHERHDRR